MNLLTKVLKDQRIYAELKNFVSNFQDAFPVTSSQNLSKQVFNLARVTNSTCKNVLAKNGLDWQDHVSVAVLYGLHDPATHASVINDPVLMRDFEEMINNSQLTHSEFSDDFGSMFTAIQHIRRGILGERNIKGLLRDEYMYLTADVSAILETITHEMTNEPFSCYVHWSLLHAEAREYYNERERVHLLRKGVFNYAIYSTFVTLLSAYLELVNVSYEANDRLIELPLLEYQLATSAQIIRYFIMNISKSLTLISELKEFKYAAPHYHKILILLDNAWGSSRTMSKAAKELSKQVKPQTWGLQNARH